MVEDDDLNLSSDDEEILWFIEHERRPYIIREREKYFENMDDKDFFTRFRLQKQTVLTLLELIEHQIETLTDRNHSIEPMNQILLTLRFFATGSFLITVGDFIKITNSSASNIIKKVFCAIAGLAPRFITMPNIEAEITRKKTEFYGKARLPRIIGSIDCTHVKIQSPGGDNAEVFRNRKGYFSLNVQTISDVNLKILDIVARWPGSAHDQTIFQNSYVKVRLENNEFGNSLLVADSGYANTMRVITSLLLPTNDLQQLYNEAVSRTRNLVERQYDLWKRRFLVLSLGLRLTLETSLAVIVATAVLHNIAIDCREENPPEEPAIRPEGIDYDEDIVLEPPIVGDQYVTARDELLNEYFPQLINN